MKIRTKHGEEIDLATVVKVHEDCLPVNCFVGEVAAALDAVLCIGFPIPEQNNMNSCLIRDGEYAMWRKVREAAGVVEDA